MEGKPLVDPLYLGKQRIRKKKGRKLAGYCVGDGEWRWLRGRVEMRCKKRGSRETAARREVAQVWC